MTARKAAASTTQKKTGQKVSSPRNVVLNEQVRISGVAELKSLLEKYLHRKRLTIDASKVKKIDTSAMQLLTAFALEAGNRSVKINWQSPSLRFLETARLLGLTVPLDLPSDEDAKLQ
jgi:anti-anti-sigma regulatory factor